MRSKVFAQIINEWRRWMRVACLARDPEASTFAKEIAGMFAGRLTGPDQGSIADGMAKGKKFPKKLWRPRRVPGGEKNSLTG